MEIEIYCDESNQQLLSSAKPKLHRFFLIGGLWLPATKRSVFKEGIAEIKHDENCFGEAKWNTVCPSKLPFYVRLVDFFFEQGLDLRFRCVVKEVYRVEE